jgi:hypothetical protein
MSLFRSCSCHAGHTAAIPRPDGTPKAAFRPRNLSGGAPDGSMTQHGVHLGKTGEEASTLATGPRSTERPEAMPADPATHARRDRDPRRARCARQYIPRPGSGRHRLDNTLHACRRQLPAGTTVMRMIAITTQNPRTRPDRSTRHAGERCHRSRTLRPRGPIRNSSGWRDRGLRPVQKMLAHRAGLCKQTSVRALPGEWR